MKKMLFKRGTALFTAMVLCLGLMHGCGNTTQSGEPTPATKDKTDAQTPSVPKEDIKIGFYGPLTGPTSLAGQASKNGAQLAVDQINQAGGVMGQKLVLVPYDDKSSPEQAVKNVTKLIDSDKVKGIVASLHSGNILAAAPIIEDAKIPTVGLGTSPEWLQKGYTYLFRALASNEYGNIGIVEFIKELNYKSVGILYRSEDYAKFNAEDIEKRLTKEGVKVVAKETFPGKDTDFTAQIANILKKNPETIVCYAGSENLGAILKQLRQGGYTGYLFGDQSLTMPDIRDVAGAAADGSIFAANYIIPEDAQGAGNEIEKTFCERYDKAFGGMPASDNAYRAYDAIYILAKGITDAASLDGTAIRDAIENVTDLEGIAGTFNFKGNKGEGINKVRNYMISSGKIVLIDDAMKATLIK